MKNIGFENLLGMICIVLLFSSCHKSEEGGPDKSPPEEKDTAYHPESTNTSSTIGFFLEDWQKKTFSAPKHFSEGSTFEGEADATISVNMNKIVTKVPQYIFGNNSNTWMGQIVDQPKLLQYITDLSPNIIRGPGGSISDIYFWNQASSSPADAPDKLLDDEGNEIDGGYWYGRNTADWTLSLDNYYKLLQKTNSTGLLTVNYGYARYGTGPHPVETAAHLAADWVRYDNGRTKYWEIGNESNGTWEAGYRIDTSKNQDGQPEIITGRLYAQHFKVFVDSMKAAAREIGSTIYIGANLLESKPERWQTTTDKNWNKGVLSHVGDVADFFIVHDYFTAYHTDAAIDEILQTAHTVPSEVMTYLKQQFSDYDVTPKPVAMTEWNIRSSGAMQNVSYIAGVHAAIALGELIKNKYGEASRWDLANGWDNGDDQGLFNIGDEPDATQWNPRPAFFYMYYFQKCFGDKMVKSTVDGNAKVFSYASSFGKSGAGIVLVNTSNKQVKVNVKLNHYAPAKHYYWYLLTGGTDHDDFSRKVLINGQGPEGDSGGPLDYASLKAYRGENKEGMKMKMPPYGVIFLNVGSRY